MKEPSETVCDRLEAEYGEYPMEENISTAALSDVLLVISTILESFEQLVQVLKRLAKALEGE